MKENAQLRSVGRQKLGGKWGMAILACLVVFVIFLLASRLGSYIPYVGGLLYLLVAGPLVLGLRGYFLRLNRGEEAATLSVLDGFKNYVPSFLLFIIVSIYVFLWSLLLVIPGIIASLRYALAFYILYDQPNIKVIEAINQSKKMMEGYKAKLFWLYLSFIGWFLLSVLTLGIGLLWVTPYVNATLAAFYDEVKQNVDTNKVLN